MKSIYTKVLIELEKDCSLQQLDKRHNRLVVLSAETEDSQLLHLIDEYRIRLLPIASYAKNKMYIKTRQCCVEIKPYEDALRNYCRQMINSGEPEWMVIAKRNGWAKVR